MCRDLTPGEPAGEPIQCGAASAAFTSALEHRGQNDCSCTTRHPADVRVQRTVLHRRRSPPPGRRRMISTVCSASPGPIRRSRDLPMAACSGGRAPFQAALARCIASRRSRPTRGPSGYTMTTESAYGARKARKSPRFHAAAPESAWAATYRAKAVSVSMPARWSRCVQAATPAKRRSTLRRTPKRTV